jgi:uncharacterized protein (PEP-CTERM system associated)
MRIAETGFMAAGEAPLRSPARVVATLALCGVFAASASYAAEYPVLPGSGYPFPVQPPPTESTTTPAAPSAATGETTSGGTTAGGTTSGGTTINTAHEIAPQTGREFSPGWTVTPSVNITEAFNDNIFQSSNHHKSDFITYITPELSIRTETPRLQASLDYAPTASIYASHGGEDSVAQNLNLYGLATLVDDALFLDVRGFAGVSPKNGNVPIGSNGLGAASIGGFGGSSANGTAFLSRNNQTQTYSFSVSPYFVHRFGDAGTLTIADRVSQSVYSNLGSSSNLLPVQGSQTNSNLFTNEALLQFITGSALGRFKNVTIADATQFSGNGVTSGAHQNVVTNRLGYAVTHAVSVFGEVGYEDIGYPHAFPPVKIEDDVWAVGTTLTPDPDSTITVGYGHRYGFNSAFLNAFYMITPRTQLFATYQTGLGTDLQEVQSLVAASGVDQFGNVVDSQTGAPLFIGNSAIGVQGNGTLNETKTFTAGATTALDRDTISLAVSASDYKAVASTTPLGYTSTVLGSTSNRAISGSVSWQHQISEAALTTVYFGYGVQNQPLFLAVAPNQNSNQNFFGASASYRYAFSETLSGIAQYGHYELGSKIPGQSYVQNIVLIGLTKQF